MKTAMTFLNLSKCHTISNASYSIIYAIYSFLFRELHTIRWPPSCCILTYISMIFFRVQFTIAWPSWSTYSRVVDDGFPESSKHRRVHSEKFHVRLNTFDIYSPVHFILYLVIYTIYHVVYWLRKSHNNGASTMKTVITISNLSKRHTITIASYSII